MKPLIDNLIVHPYTRYMNDKYQQASLTVQQICQGILSGDIAATIGKQELRYLGYADSWHDVLIGFYTPQMTVQEVWALLKMKEATVDEGIGLLRRNGWSQDFAANKLAAVTAEHDLRDEQRLVHNWMALAKDRFIDPQTFRAKISTLHLDDDDVDRYTQEVADFVETSHKHFTHADILYMVDRNIITEAEVDQWAEEVGYSPEQRQTLALYFASKELDYEEQVQKKKDAAAKKAAAPKPPTTKPPTTTTT
jgi:hypothetical protein